MQPRPDEAMARSHAAALGHNLGAFRHGMVETARLANCSKCGANVVYDLLLPGQSVGGLALSQKGKA